MCPLLSPILHLLTAVVTICFTVSTAKPYSDVLLHLKCSTTHAEEDIFWTAVLHLASPNRTFPHRVERYSYMYTVYKVHYANICIIKL